MVAGITSIQEDDGTILGDSIAGVDRKTGEVFVNRALIRAKGLTKDQIFFMLLHEAGHMVKATTDEKTVDAWAHQEYLKRGYSPRQSVFALTKVLRFDKQEDFDRAAAQLTRAKFYDDGQDNFQGSGEAQEGNAVLRGSQRQPVPGTHEQNKKEKKMRFATPYNSFAPSMRAFSREYPMAVTSYADVQGEELSLFVGSRNLNHFDLQGLIDSATNVATKVANVVDKVQSYIPKSTSTPPLTSTQVQNGISPNTPAAQQDTWTKYKVPIIGGAALVILIVAILILAKK